MIQSRRINMWKAHGTGFITTIGNREEKRTFYASNTENGAFITFRVRSRRYAGGKNIWEDLDCKKFIKGSPEKFCELLEEKTYVSVTGTLEKYYNKETKITRFTINCDNIDFCGKAMDKPSAEPQKQETPKENTNKPEADPFA